MVQKKIQAFFLLVILFLFVSMTGNAQVNNSGYATQWKKVDEFIKKGLTKSALEEVTTVYNAAKKAGNDVQIIKSLLYQLNLNQNVKEDAGVKNIKAVEGEITYSRQPAKSILQS